MYNTLYESIYSIIKDALVEYPLTKVIESESSGTKPPATYVSIDINSIEQSGLAQQATLLNTANEMEYLVKYNMIATFSIIGKEAGNIGFSLHKRLKNSSLNREEASLRNLSILGKSPLRKSSYRDGDKWVQYFNFTVDFSFISYFTDEIQYVQQVVVEDSNNSIVFTIP